jgi:hypothetical protein
MTSQTTNLGSLSQRLFREWHWMCQRAELVDHAHRWPLDGPPPHSLDEVLRRCGYGGRRDDDTADRLLGQLVMVATTDPVAARVVLQRVLPGMLAIARRRTARRPEHSDTALAELVGAMWMLIRTSSVERPRRHVAAHLLRSADYEAFRRSRRRLYHQREVPMGDALPDVDAVTDPTSAWLDDPRRRLGEVLGHGRAAGVPRSDLTLLTSLASGEPVDSLAGRLGISDRALRARRATAVARLREVAAAA